MGSKLSTTFCLYLILLQGLVFGSEKHPSCWVSNDTSIFDSTPVFHLQTKERIVENIHWQISNSSEFDWISPELQKVSNSTDEVFLSEETQKHLIPGETYYFRFRTEFYNKRSSWSKPFSFTHGTPQINGKECHWTKRFHIDDATWVSVQPYLLPSNHPLKSKLDQIFSGFRATTDANSMKFAGFETLDTWKWDKVFVARHPQLKGFLIKAYLDDHLYMDDKSLVNRIVGAENLRSAIKAFGYQSYFKVPRKWLYPLPDFPGALPGLRRKNFILIVEDMDLVTKEKNEQLYRKSADTKLLHALFNLMNTLGLDDSIYIKNIPFSKNGKIAFVDTERHGLWPIPFEKLTPMLSPKMKEYWKQLTHSQ